MNPVLEKVIKDKYGKQTAESYDQLAYDFFWGYKDSLKAAAFSIFHSKIHQLQASQNISIVDLGAGTGNLTIEILNQFKDFSQLNGALDKNWQDLISITLQDQSPEMLKIAKQKVEASFSAPVTLAYQDMLSFFEGSKKYDIICSSFAVHHLPPEQKKCLFELIFASLNPQGVFVLVDRMKGHSEEEEQSFLVSVSSPFFASVGSVVSLEKLTLLIQQQFNEDLDQPSTVTEQVNWMRACQFNDVKIAYLNGPIAVLIGKR